jgi:hypothetical protein
MNESSSLARSMQRAIRRASPPRQLNWSSHAGFEFVLSSCRVAYVVFRTTVHSIDFSFSFFDGRAVPRLRNSWPPAQHATRSTEPKMWGNSCRQSHRPTGTLWPMNRYGQLAGSKQGRSVPVTAESKGPSETLDITCVAGLTGAICVAFEADLLK